MPRTIRFSVFGHPRPKGSTKSHFDPTQQRIVTRPASDSLKEWEGRVRAQAQRHVGEAFFTTAVELTVMFYFARPKSVSVKKRTHHVVIPDLSKLVRGVEDAMTGVLYRDDCLITRIVAEKYYGPTGQPSRCDITLTELEQPAVAQPLLVREAEELPHAHTSPTSR